MKYDLRRKGGFSAVLWVLFASFGFASIIYLSSPIIWKSDSHGSRFSMMSPPDEDSLYQVLLKDINELYAKKEYEACLVSLRKAIDLKPDVPSLKERLVRVEGLLAQQKKDDAEYRKLCEKGDGYFAQEKYLDAKSVYQMAIDVKPDDTCAREKLKQTMSLLRAQKASNILFDVAVANADKLFAAKKYTEATQEYQNALKILPDASYPKEQINAIIKIQIDEKVRNELYEKAVKDGDRFFQAQNYRRSLQEFKVANEQKPEQSYPVEMIEKLNKIISDLEALEEAYRDAIARADALFGSEKYQDARSAYDEAHQLKEKEPYPLTRIREIDAILAEALRLEQNFQRYVSLADSLYIARNFIRARQNYQLALDLKPGDSYLEAMLTKTASGVEKQMADATAIEEAYASAIADADKFFADSLLNEAKQGYLNALDLKPDEQYPRDQIALIDAGLAEQLAAQKALDDQYNELISQADQLLETKEYLQSQEVFIAALNLKPEESYPADKLEELEGILANLEQQRLLDQQYRDLIARADAFFQEASYDSARATYTEALSIEGGDPYPEEKIREIDELFQLMADQAALSAKYDSIIVVADELFAMKDYPTSRDRFTLASSIKPEEAYPKNQVARITQILDSLAAAEALELAFAEAVREGDELLGKSQFLPAKASYQKALGHKPGEAYPTEKIAEIDLILASMAELEADYNRLIAEADAQFQRTSYDSARSSYQEAGTLRPENPYWQEQIAGIDQILAALMQKELLEARYDSLITLGDNFLADRDYQSARDHFTQASGLKPQEEYPKARIVDIIGILDSIATQQALELAYTTAIREGDDFLSQNQYLPAKSAFQKALEHKPEETYPVSRIAEIDSVLGAMAAQEALDQQYQETIRQADQLFADSDYDTARIVYQNALSLKEGEAYPQEQIAAIDSIVEERARQAQLDADYTRLIADADAQFQRASYDSARATYQTAGTFRPENPYWQEQIAEIGRILEALRQEELLKARYDSLITLGDDLFNQQEYRSAKDQYAQASLIQTTAAYPRTRIARLTQIIDSIAEVDAINKAYSDAIASGDSLFAEAQLVSAREAFSKALDYKPDQEYPAAKISEIDTMMAEQARLEALEQQYQTIIQEADQLFAKELWDSAMLVYQKAIALKASESYPKEQVAAIDSIRAEIARQARIDADYARLIADADAQLKRTSYDSARSTYQTAGELRPGKQYWQDQIAEIDRILAEIRQLNAAYTAALKYADSLFAVEIWEEARKAYQEASGLKTQESYPKTRITEINNILAELEGRRNRYDRLVSEGNDLLAQTAYIKAKDQYQQALDLFPEETYPRQQIREIDRVVDSIYRANKADYDKAIGDGDRYFNTYEYDKAVDAYTRAINFLPMENYPREMIAKIRITISENAIADVLSEPVVIQDGTEEKFSFEPVNIASRRNNFIYLKVKNLSGQPFTVLMRYGKDGQTNGGLAIRNLSTDGAVNERLISVKTQDPWYRIDNNWISLYPQGGDIEVSFIQVSRAIE